MSKPKRLCVIESNLSGSGFQGLKIAKEKGYHITFLTCDLERYLEIPAGKHHIDTYVDEIRQCNTNSVDAIFKEMASEFASGYFDAVLTLAEYDIVPTAIIAEKLGLTGLSPEAAKRCRNKHFTRLACAASGVESPEFVSVRNADELRAAVAKVGLPCIVKPADETSSTDVMVCYSEQQALLHLQSIKSKTRNVRGQERYEYVLVEEYVIGHEVSVESVTVGGETTVLGVTDKLVDGNRYFVEIGHSFPSTLPAEQIAACIDLAKRALAAVGYDFGVAHTEVKIGAKGVKIIEINGRPAGDRIPDLVRMSTGFDLVKAHVDIFCDGQTEEVAVASKGGAAIRFLTGTPGVISAVEGLDSVGYCNGVTEVVIGDLVGRQVQQLTKSSTRLGYVIAKGSSGYEAMRIADTAINQVNLVMAEHTRTMEEPCTSSTVSST